MKFAIRSLIMLIAIVRYDAARIKRKATTKSAVNISSTSGTATQIDATEGQTKTVDKTDSAVTHLLRDSKASSKDICHSIHQLQCQDEDITSFGPVEKSAHCCQACQDEPGCNAWTWDWYSSEKVCHLKRACNYKRTTSPGYHSGIAPNPGPYALIDEGPSALVDETSGTATQIDATEGQTKNVDKTDSAVTHLLRDSNASFEEMCGSGSIHELQCHDEDIRSFGPVKKSADCCQACQNEPGCNAWTWDWYSSEKLCHLKPSCYDRCVTCPEYHSGILQIEGLPPGMPD